MAERPRIYFSVASGPVRDGWWAVIDNRLLVRIGALSESRVMRPELNFLSPACRIRVQDHPHQTEISLTYGDQISRERRPSSVRASDRVVPTGASIWHR